MVFGGKDLGIDFLAEFQQICFFNLILDVYSTYLAYLYSVFCIDIWSEIISICVISNKVKHILR